MSIPFSIELYPLASADAAAQLYQTLPRLQALKPEYFSVTYGAGGCTRGQSLQLVEQLQQAGEIVAPHISAIGAKRDEVRAQLQHYQCLGIYRLFVLRGDTPSGMGSRGDFSYASELVQFIQTEAGDAFQINVAAYPETHPQAASPAADLAALKRKQDAGASGAVTQYFFNADAFLHLRDAAVAAGVTMPITPGVLPLTRYKTTARLAEARGVELPRWVQRKLHSFGDDAAAIREFGLEFTSKLCQRLIAEGVPALHFFSLNQAGAVETLCQRLSLGHAVEAIA
jgi:methylenetetrahydrofolate reductase (NADPH)